MTGMIDIFGGEPMCQHMNTLIDSGVELDFYGIDSNRFKVGFDDVTFVFEAVDDPDDGYRSYLETIIVAEEQGDVFFKQPIATVVIESCNANDNGDDFGGITLRDASDPAHVWLKIGTDYGDNYYPFFVFRYEPYGITAKLGDF